MASRSIPRFFGDVHEYFLSQIRRACTLKKRGRANVYFHHEGHEDHGDQFFCTGDRRASDPRNKQSPRITLIDANQEKGFALPKGPPIGWTRVATATELRETEQNFLRSYWRDSRASLVSTFGIRLSAVAPGSP